MFKQKPKGKELIACVLFKTALMPRDSVINKTFKPFLLRPRNAVGESAEQMEKLLIRSVTKCFGHATAIPVMNSTQLHSPTLSLHWTGSVSSQS